MVKISLKTLPRSRSLAATISIFIVMAVAVADYFTGYQISLSIFYLLAISFALWNVGTLFAVVISVLCVAGWLLADWAAGVIYPNDFVPVWNALIMLFSYLIVIWLLVRLKSFNRFLEAGIRERTVSLAAEISERERLEKEILTISEREQQEIGRELHDSLCQHLTATALAAQVLDEKLTERSQLEAKDSKYIVNLVEEGIVIARNLARGLFPVEIEAEGLISALNELAEKNSVNSGIACHVEAGQHALIYDTSVATHLFRIAQESVSNAIKYSGAKNILISLGEIERGTMLIIKDDGCGIVEFSRERKGMGLRIMRHRAGLIGAEFDLKSDSRGTVVSCIIPLDRNRKTFQSK